MINKYISGKYDPFIINDVWIGDESECLIPTSYNRTSVIEVAVKAVYRMIKLALTTLIYASWNYKFAKFDKFSDDYDDKILFFLPTLNNQRSLAKVIDVVLKSRDNVSILKKEFTPEAFPMLLVSLFGLLYIPSFIKEYKHLDFVHRRRASYFLPFLLHSPGTTWFFIRLIEKHRPQGVILANDHLFYTRTLELVCEDFGVATVYVQHASVSYGFPPLRFGCSFLDGLDSVEKYVYHDKPTIGHLFSLGAARYDELHQYRINRIKKRRNIIGIGVNILDSNEKVNFFCNYLLTYFPSVKVKVRAHPGLKETPFSFDNKERVIYTNASDEQMKDFLDSIDLLISSDSGIHFDALVGGVPSMCYNFGDREFTDTYEYVKNGLIPYAKDKEIACQMIEEGKVSINSAKVAHYDASFGKSYSGHCSNIIADYILHDFNFEYMQNKYNLEERHYEGHSYYEIGKSR